MHTKIRLAAVLWLIGFLVAIGFQPASLAVPAPENLPAAGDLVKPFDDLLESVATIVPAFGGVFRASDGRQNVWVVGAKQDDASKAYDELTKLGPAAFTADGIAVLDAQFTFLDLYRWRKIITEELLGRDGVVISGIEDEKNRLRVALTDIASQEATLKKNTEARGIPWEAIALEEGSALVPYASDDLRDYWRPLRGGLQIASLKPGMGCCCTLGFTATRAGFDGFVTASHCGTPNVQDGWGYGQPDTANAIGWEVRDTAGLSCPFGLCRFADVEFDRKLVGTEILRGYLARTPLNSIAWNGADMWRIVAEIYAGLGTVANKVGRSSGYTTGTITHKCDDSYTQGAVKFVCQDFANFLAQTSDSGSPVFQPTGVNQDVRLLGIFIGTRTDGVEIQRVFSPISQIQSSYELGPLTNCAAGFSC
jgi:hypothetical protein